MKLIVFLTLLLLVVSCGNNKLRLKKVNPINKQEIVDVEADNHSRTYSHSTKAKTERTTTQSLENEVNSEELDDVRSNKPVVQPDLKTVQDEFPLIASDTLESAENDEIKAIAQKAEDLSTIAVWINRGALVLLLLSAAIALFASSFVPLFIGGVIGFLLAVSAIVLGFISKSKSHNTELGSRQSTKAIVFGFALTLLFGVAILLTTSSL